MLIAYMVLSWVHSRHDAELVDEQLRLEREVWNIRACQRHTGVMVGTETYIL